nr:MAG TPA: hypothetical protein [Caudoviricetes sp.]
MTMRCRNVQITAHIVTFIATTIRPISIKRTF